MNTYRKACNSRQPALQPAGYRPSLKCHFQSVDRVVRFILFAPWIYREFQLLSEVSPHKIACRHVACVPNGNIGPPSLHGHKKTGSRSNVPCIRKLPSGNADYVLVGRIIVYGTIEDAVSGKLLEDFLGVAVQGRVANVPQKVAEPCRFFKNRASKHAFDKRAPLLTRIFVTRRK